MNDSGKRRLRLLGTLALTIVCGAGLACGVVFCQAPRLLTEREWYEMQSERLAGMEITPESITTARPWQEGEQSWDYCLRDREAIIPIGTSDGVYIVWHSFHDNDTLGWFTMLKWRLWTSRGKGFVNDAILAIDRQGRLYRCGGHVCGSLRLRSDKEVATIEDFLQTMNSTSGDRWESYPRHHFEADFNSN